MQFTIDRNKELFRSFALVEGSGDHGLMKPKSSKKLKSNHARTASFKSPSSTKFRGSNLHMTLDNFLGVKKQSLRKV